MASDNMLYKMKRALTCSNRLCNKYYHPWKSMRFLYLVVADICNIAGIRHASVFPPRTNRIDPIWWGIECENMCKKKTRQRNNYTNTVKTGCSRKGKKCGHFDPWIMRQKLLNQSPEGERACHQDWLLNCLKAS